MADARVASRTGRAVLRRGRYGFDYDRRECRFGGGRAQLRGREDATLSDTRSRVQAAAARHTLPPRQSRRISDSGHERLSDPARVVSCICGVKSKEERKGERLNGEWGKGRENPFPFPLFPLPFPLSF